jgi:hypothetical protein
VKEEEEKKELEEKAREEVAELPGSFPPMRAPVEGEHVGLLNAARGGNGGGRGRKSTKTCDMCSTREVPISYRVLIMFFFFSFFSSDSFQPR